MEKNIQKTETSGEEMAVERLPKSNKFWLLVLGGIMAVSVIAALLLGQAPMSHAFAGSANIYKDGVLTESVNLASVKESYTIDILGNSGFNMLEVELGRIRVLEADCPDGICKRQGWVSGGLIPIVCLPHRLVITFEGGTAGVDAIVG